MKNVCLLCIIFFFSISCKKDPVKDKIVYTDFEPDIVLNSITGTSFIAGDQIFLPSDTTCSVSINVTPDEDFGFVFQATNYYKHVSASSPGANYNYQLSVSALHSSGFIFAEKSIDNCPDLLSDQEFIGPGSSFVQSALLCDDTHPLFNHCGPYTGDKYIPFKKRNGLTTLYGWIHIEFIGKNGIKIKEIAINKTGNRTILAGQKQ